MSDPIVDKIVAQKYGDDPTHCIRCGCPDPTSEETIAGNDKVLDWMETHLGHYDWQTATAAVEYLLRAVQEPPQ